MCPSLTPHTTLLSFFLQGTRGNFQESERTRGGGIQQANSLRFQTARSPSLGCKIDDQVHPEHPSYACCSVLQSGMPHSKWFETGSRLGEPVANRGESVPARSDAWPSLHTGFSRLLTARETGVSVLV
jgi:hypothetical protein